MKIEIDIPIEELDYESDYDYSDKGNHIDVLIEMITDKAASLLVQHIDYDYKISLEKSLEDKINNIEKCLETKITERVSKDSYKVICDIRMCYWGDGTAGKILQGNERYSAEYKIKIHNEELKDDIIRVLTTFNWKEYLSCIAMRKIQQFHIVDVLKKEIPQIK